MKLQLELQKQRSICPNPHQMRTIRFNLHVQSLARSGSGI